MSIKHYHLLILAFAALLIGSCRAVSFFGLDSQPPKIENVRFHQQSDTVNVYYTLRAPDGASRYEVDLLLSLGDNKNYRIPPTSTSGAIGRGISPGENHRITWFVSRDFPSGLNGQEVQFIVNAQRISRNDQRWMYYAGGALLLGAGVSAGILLFGNGTGDLPGPPSRPSGWH